ARDLGAAPVVALVSCCPRTLGCGLSGLGGARRDEGEVVGALRALELEVVGPGAADGHPPGEARVAETLGDAARLVQRGRVGLRSGQLVVLAQHACGPRRPPR